MRECAAEDGDEDERHAEGAGRGAQLLAHQNLIYTPAACVIPVPIGATAVLYCTIPVSIGATAVLYCIIPVSIRRHL